MSMTEVTLTLRRFDETIGIDADTSLSCVNLYNLRDVFFLEHDIFSLLDQFSYMTFCLIE